jgi:hypothetical protein
VEDVAEKVADTGSGDAELDDKSGAFQHSGKEAPAWRMRDTSS